MVDCPAALHPGADLIISLSVYMLPSAFAKPLSANGNLQQHKNMFEEGQESQDEQNLRERKSSLLKLFDAVSLKPQVGPDLSKFKDKSDSEMHAEDVQKMTDASKPKAAVRTEIVGDGEEVEVEEGEDLSENELDTIYKRLAPQMLIKMQANVLQRAQENDRAMAEMEPPASFTLTLRGYQKQALM